MILKSFKLLGQTTGKSYHFLRFKRISKQFQKNLNMHVWFQFIAM